MSTLSKSVKIPADLLVALGDEAGEFWSSLEVENRVHDAIRAWLKRDTPGPASDETPAAHSAEEGGYQWKQLYLPPGTRVRASFHRLPYFGVVAAQGVRHGGEVLSPSAFANLFGSGNRNAWKAIWLRFPGSEQWVLADTCRQLQNQACAQRFGVAPAASPAPASCAGTKAGFAVSCFFCKSTTLDAHDPDTIQTGHRGPGTGRRGRGRWPGLPADLA